MKKKIATIVGARPQFIKAAVVSRQIRASSAYLNGQVEELIYHTGQHFDHNMSKIFFEQLSIPEPYQNLGISGSGHGAMTGQMMIRLEECFLNSNPDLVLIYGDTNSTLAGALVAAKLKIPIAHVEAGLRSYNMDMPEEVNRILADRLSTILFCPSHSAVTNLLGEGLPQANTSHGIPMEIHNSGDVMYDAVLFYKDLIKSRDRMQGGGQYAVATIHRQENVDDLDRLRSILDTLNEIALEIPIFIPIHPRTRLVLQKQRFTTPNLRFIEPLGYIEMLGLLDGCQLVFTDSGGLQKEAFFLNKPCITLRDETEWVELVQEGANILAGSERQKIMNAYQKARAKSGVKFKPIYGQGNAGSFIVSKILTYLGS